MTNFPSLLNCAIRVDEHGRNIAMPLIISNALDTIDGCRKAGFAVIHGYRPDSKKYMGQPVFDYTLLTNLDYTAMRLRRINELNALQYAAIPANVIPDNKLKGKTAIDWFDTRKAFHLTSDIDSLLGATTNAHVAAHKRNYSHFGEGAKLNLMSEKLDGIQVPIQDDNGTYYAASLLLQAIVINKRTIEYAQYKPVNSGAGVLMSNAMWDTVDQKGCHVKYFSLKPDSFDSLSIDTNTVIPDNLEWVSSRVS